MRTQINHALESISGLILVFSKGEDRTRLTICKKKRKEKNGLVWRYVMYYWIYRHKRRYSFTGLYGISKKIWKNADTPSAFVVGYNKLKSYVICTCDSKNISFCSDFGPIKESTVLCLPALNCYWKLEKLDIYGMLW